MLAGDLDGALAALAQGEAACPDHLTERARTLGLRADVLVLKHAPAADIEAAFAAALTCASRHSKAHGLRSATSYARWLCARGRAGEAREVLEPLYASFTEGFDTYDLCEARQLLDAMRAGAPPSASRSWSAEVQVGSGE